MQRLWREKLDWDESIPVELHTEWDNYASQLSLLHSTGELYLRKHKKFNYTASVIPARRHTKLVFISKQSTVMVSSQRLYYAPNLALHHSIVDKTPAFWQLKYAIHHQ